MNAPVTPVPVKHLAPRERHRPQLVLCLRMPPNDDWSEAFRSSASVQEYLLLGPDPANHNGRKEIHR